VIPALERGLDTDRRVIVGFRPEAAQVNQESGQLQAKVYASDLHGGYSMLHLELSDGDVVHARAGRDVDYPIGMAVKFSLNPEMVRFFHPETEKALVNGSARV
jgi:ABC-type sugar transport system ATPase subunit